VSSGRCPTCGFDGSALSPTDAAVALRSYPRRFRELVGSAQGPDQDDKDAEEGAEVVRAAVLEEVALATGAIAAAGADLQRVLVEPDPVLTSTGDPDGLASGIPDPAVALDELTKVASGLAATVEGTSGATWTRTGIRKGEKVSALDLAREAVHGGAHHLRRAATIADRR
jgi:hypothetical protein